jgi:hypothetical protein
MSDLPRSMRVPRRAGKAHYYINPTGVDIYPNGLGRVRLTRRQLWQILTIMRKEEKK